MPTPNPTPSVPIPHSGLPRFPLRAPAKPGPAVPAFSTTSKSTKFSTWFSAGAPRTGRPPHRLRRQHNPPRSPPQSRIQRGIEPECFSTPSCSPSTQSARPRHSHSRAGRWLLEHMAAQRIREQNRRPLNPKQLRRFTTAIADALESEIDDHDHRHRISERLKEVVRDTNRNHDRSLATAQNHAPRTQGRRPLSKGCRCPRLHVGMRSQPLTITYRSNNEHEIPTILHAPASQFLGYCSPERIATRAESPNFARPSGTPTGAPKLGRRNPNRQSHVTPTGIRTLCKQPRAKTRI